MKNAIFSKLTSKIRICVKGKNIERFIKRLASKNIELYEIERITYNEINLVILKSDYSTVEEIKTIYDISVKEVYGFERLKQLLAKNKYMIVAFCIGLVFLYVLTHTTFEIEVIHNKKELRTLLQEELAKNGISKWKPIRSY